MEITTDIEGAMPFLRQAADLFEGICDPALRVHAGLDASGMTLSHPGGVIRLPLREGSAAKTAKHALFLLLRDLSGHTPPWGSLTGVKPEKKFALLAASSSPEQASAYFESTYAVAPEKTRLLRHVLEVQSELLAGLDDGCCLYVNIPVCPARCAWCSFPSSVASEGSGVLDSYLGALETEISLTASWLEGREKILWVYVGGGTPAILSAPQISRLMRALEPLCRHAKEFTFEAGRPELIAPEKVSAMRDGGAGRISVNLQTSNEESLRRAGRLSPAGEFDRAVELACGAGFSGVNCDIILGLDGETRDDYRASLLRAVSGGASAVTLHALCRKRASGLAGEPASRQGLEVSAFMDGALDWLEGRGMRPYYVYRQRHSAGNAENTGYAMPGAECVYNILMMGADRRHVIGVGAGAATRIAVPARTTSVGIYNVKNLDIYIRDPAAAAAKKLSAAGYVLESAK